MKTPRPLLAARAPASLALGLAVLSSLGACDNVVDYGEVTLRIATPETFSDGQTGSLLDDASEIEVLIDVDGAVTSERFGDASALRIDAAAAAPEGSVVRISLNTTGTALPDARGRSETFDISDAATPAPVAYLAPPQRAHLLYAALPDARADAAICSDGTDVLVIGGRAPGDGAVTLRAGSLWLSRDTREVTEGPALPAARFGAGCALLENGAVLLAGGCTDVATDVTNDVLSRAAARDVSGRFDGLGALDGAAAYCGAAAATSPEGAVIQYGARVEFRNDAGDLVADVLLPSAVHFADLAVSASGRAFVAGGYNAPDRVTPSSQTFEATDNGVTALASTGPVARFGDEVVQLQSDALRGLTGNSGPLHTRGGTLSGITATSLAAHVSGRFAALSDAGDVLVLFGASPERSVPVDPPRPGGRVVSEAGGAFYIVGGGAAGVHLVVP